MRSIDAMGGLFSRLFSSSIDNSWKSDAEFAMESSWFCVLCGTPLDITGDAYNLNPEDERFKVSVSQVEVSMH
jgi:hypothetical protein